MPTDRRPCNAGEGEGSVSGVRVGLFGASVCGGLGTFLCLSARWSSAGCAFLCLSVCLLVSEERASRRAQMVRFLGESELRAKIAKGLKSLKDELMKQHLTNYGEAVLLKILEEQLICKVYDNGGYHWSADDWSARASTGQAGFEGAALFVLGKVGAEELARLHTETQVSTQVSTAHLMGRLEASTKVEEEEATKAAHLAERAERKAKREMEAFENNRAARLLEAYVGQRLGPDDAEGKTKEAEGAGVDDAVQREHEVAEAAPAEAAADAGATRGDDAGGAVEHDEGGDQSGAGQSGADESSGASDEAAGGGVAAPVAASPPPPPPAHALPPRPVEAVPVPQMQAPDVRSEAGAEDDAADAAGALCLAAATPARTPRSGPHASFVAAPPPYAYVCSTGFSREVREALESDVVKAGAISSPDFTNLTTHLVAPSAAEQVGLHTTP